MQRAGTWWWDDSENMDPIWIFYNTKNWFNARQTSGSNIHVCNIFIYKGKKTFDFIYFILVTLKWNNGKISSITFQIFIWCIFHWNCFLCIYNDNFFVQVGEVSGKLFRDIMKFYRKQPQATSSIYREVLIKTENDEKSRNRYFSRKILFLIDSFTFL